MPMRVVLQLTELEEKLLAERRSHEETAAQLKKLQQVNLP